MSIDLLLFIVVCVLAILIFAASSGTHYRDGEMRLILLERKINRILDHLGITEDVPIDGVQALLLAGKKINAIKLYREQTGASLKDAKDAVERMEVSLKN